VRRIWKRLSREAAFKALRRRPRGSAAGPAPADLNLAVRDGLHRREPERAGRKLRAAGLAESSHLPKPDEKQGVSAPNRFYMYGVIGRLAMLAASYELEATDPDAEVYE
jgi:hypothetical protein